MAIEKYLFLGREEVGEGEGEGEGGWGEGGQVFFYLFQTCVPTWNSTGSGTYLIQVIFYYVYKLSRIKHTVL